MRWASPDLLAVAAGEREVLTGRQLDQVVAQRADPKLGAGQILQDRDRPPGAVGGLAHPRTVSACSSSVPWE